MVGGKKTSSLLALVVDGPYLSKWRIEPWDGEDPEELLVGTAPSAFVSPSLEKSKLFRGETRKGASGPLELELQADVRHPDVGLGAEFCPS